jgi:acetyltransferase-like isoleucine patch superfamily enzyme
MNIVSKIKSKPRLKRLVVWAVARKRNPRARLWVRWFINPVIHKRGYGSTIRHRTRMDVFPWNRFELGRYSTIEDFSTINNGVGDVIIGREVRIGMGNTIIGPVTIGNGVRLAQNIVLSGLNHNYQDVHIPIHAQGVSTAPIVLDDETWIGANSVVVAGVTIGKHAVIAAGSVVTKNIPAFSLAVGNPAKVIKMYNENSGSWERVQNDG